MARTITQRVLQAWWRLSRSLTLGVRGVVTDAQGRVLLVKHTYTTGWHLPGGGVERGETSLEALTRELREEAGVGILGNPRLMSVHANHAAFPNDHVLVYTVDGWVQVASDAHGEIAETGFFDPDAPPPETTPATCRRLAEVFFGTSVSPNW